MKKIIQYAISDTVVMTGRVMKQVLRSLDTIITVLLMPVALLLAMNYVIGGAMDLGGVATADYMLPGIIIMCVLSGVAYTAYRLHVDVQKGIFERFHSMPIAKSSILGGHVLTSVVTNAVSVIAIVLIGLLIGFRPAAGAVGWLLAALVVLLFITAMTWISVFFGLITKSVETVGVFSYLLIGLTFTSSSFAPVSSMPPALAAFARHQPMTAVADSIRLLLLGEPVGSSFAASIVWCVAIGAVFWALSVNAYRRQQR
ncbi:MAG: ABC transporter permease [Clostridiales Family XIII bacterium]|jgi:ABC-2 type transport system permease protein|nr:ABC transporter permease [Clostridiales Family XIII bacterium]